jgi:Right handed beta helix region
MAALALSSCLGQPPEPAGQVDADRNLRAEPSFVAPSGRAASRAPLRPSARICGSSELLGPAEPPAGARAVTPGQRLSTVADDSPPGTTFWLTPGTHLLGTGPYDQVRPKDGQRFIGGPGAVLDGQGSNRYAFAGPAAGVRIEHLTIQNFGTDRRDNFNEGVVNHDAGDGWVIRHNTVSHNAGAGVLVGSGNRLVRNCLRANGQYGFSVFEPGGVSDVVLAHNEIAGNNTARWEEVDPECGCTGGGKFWETTNATVVGNWVHHNRGVGLWADTNNTGFLFGENFVDSNHAEGLIYEISYNAAILRNSFLRNALVDGPKDPGFPHPAVYISESGSDSRAGDAYGATFRIAGNRFVDNWSGLVGWENADRFAGSPANTSTGSTTLVNPDVATQSACSDPERIAELPYFRDCRWRTTHLRVERNLFRMSPSHLGRECTATRGCGYVGLFANWGSYPDWSPYMGEVVMDAITFEQDNVWSRNAYVGPWRFMVHGQGTRVSWDSWRAAPYGQDRHSTLK